MLERPGDFLDRIKSKKTIFFIYHDALKKWFEGTHFDVKFNGCLRKSFFP